MGYQLPRGMLLGHYLSKPYNCVVLIHDIFYTLIISRVSLAYVDNCRDVAWTRFGDLCEPAASSLYECYLLEAAMSEIEADSQ